MDHEFRHNIFKVAVDPRVDSRVDRQTTLTMLWRNSLAEFKLETNYPSRRIMRLSLNAKANFDEYFVYI